MPFSSICSWPKLLPKRQQNVGKKFHGIQPRKGVKNGEKMMMRAENNPEKRLKMVKNWWWERKKWWKINDEGGAGRWRQIRAFAVQRCRCKGSRLEIIWTGRKTLRFLDAISLRFILESEWLGRLNFLYSSFWIDQAWEEMQVSQQKYLNLKSGSKLGHLQYKYRHSDRYVQIQIQIQIQITHT